MSLTGIMNNLPIRWNVVSQKHSHVFLRRLCLDRSCVFMISTVPKSSFTGLNTNFSFISGRAALLQSRTLPSVGFRRSLYQKFVGDKTLEKIRSSDGIPKGYNLIYRTTLSNYMLGVQVFVLFSLVATISLGILFAFVKKPELGNTESDRKEKIDLLVSQSLEENRKKFEEKNQRLKDFKVDIDRSLDEKFEVNVSPQAELMSEEDWLTFAVYVSTLFALNIAMWRLRNLIPVRLYAGKKKHCVAIFNSSLIPGKLVHHDFVAGLLKKKPVKFLGGPSTMTIFQDGSGHRMLLLEHYFRRPSDLDYLLGVSNVDPNDENIGDVMKSSGSLANLPRRNVKGKDT